MMCCRGVDESDPNVVRVWTSITGIVLCSDSRCGGGLAALVNPAPRTLMWDTLAQRPYCPLLSLQQQHHEQRQVVDRPMAFLFYCCRCTLSLLNSPTSASLAAATACVGAGLATGLVCQPRRWPAGLSAAWASAPTCSSGAWHKLHCALQRSAIAELSPTANMYAEGKQLLQWASDATCSSGVP